MSTTDDRHRKTNGASQQGRELLVDELRRTTDVQRMRELVILLDRAIFSRQQEPALNSGRVEKEEHSMKEALDLLPVIKVKKLGFPEIT